MSRNNIQILNSSCHDNLAINGSILYSIAGGNSTFMTNNFQNNKADVGGILYTISGRYLNQVTNSTSTFSNCNIADNYGKKGLFYSTFDELIINYSSITYLNKSLFPLYKSIRLLGEKLLSLRIGGGQKSQFNNL